MGAVTKGDEGNRPMADRNRPDDEEERDDRDEAAERPEAREPQLRAPAGGFFSIYKSGQGYWTRMMTAGATALLVVLLAQFIYVTLKTRTPLDKPNEFPVWSVSIASLIAAVGFFLLWRYQNKPGVVDFLIATESEMKKVNWTSRKDLIGSTKVVIFFMFMISAILFVIDVIFGYFFQLIRVLKTGPFG